MNEEELLKVLHEVFGDGDWPETVRLLKGLREYRLSGDERAARLAAHTSPKRLRSALESGDPVAALMGKGLKGLESVSPKSRQKAHRKLGQMLAGKCAELIFVDRYKAVMESEQLRMDDESARGTDTDFRLLNGSDRPIFRINIKFHGSQFRKALELVGLDPEDCFALATYKIKSANEKYDKESLPFFFAIVGVQNLPAEKIGENFPEAIRELTALAVESGAPHLQRFEDAIIEYVVRAELPIYQQTRAEIEKADWRVLGARKARRLMKDKLFQRVYALSQRGFAQNFKGAEVDMHFSVSKELVPLQDFLERVKKHGVMQVGTSLAAGDL